MKKEYLKELEMENEKLMRVISRLTDRITFFEKYFNFVEEIGDDIDRDFLKEYTDRSIELNKTIAEAENIIKYS